jgi:tail assembly chaperone
MASEPTEFELEGRRFEVKRLSPDDACLGLELLGIALGPALSTLLLAKATGDGADGEEPKIDFAALLQSLLTQASKISALVKLFAPRSKFDRGQNGILIDLKPFVGEVFEGRVDLMIAFLVQAVRGEYSSFLSGNNALAALLPKAAANASKSPPAPTA